MIYSSSYLIIISACLPSLQSQVYRSQPDLVSAVYDTTASTMAVDYSYVHYPDQTDPAQNCSQYMFPSEYNADSTWNAPEQRKYTIPSFNKVAISWIALVPAFILSILLLSKLIFPLAPPRPATPEKFTIPHRCARFGPGGHLVQVLPNLPSAGQPALVDIHNLEVRFLSDYITVS